jgi:diacylglycerol kinase (ATP)
VNTPWLAILNPAAGRGRALRAWPALERALAEASVPVELATTASAGDATRLARDAVAAGRRRILAVGGDGTLHEVLNGLLGGAARVTLAVAPGGTGNDWARGLHIPHEPRAVAAMLARGRVLAHDVGEIESAVDGGRESRFFLNLAGVGYDAWVLEHLPRRGPKALAYLAAVVSGLWRYRPPKTRWQAGTERREGSFFAVFAANGRYAGGGMQFAPRARIDDGLLDLVAIDHLGITATLRRLPKIYSGHLLEDAAVAWRQAPSLEIATDPPVRVQADGQLLGLTPASIRLHRAALDVIVP